MFFCLSAIQSDKKLKHAKSVTAICSSLRQDKIKTEKILPLGEGVLAQRAKAG